MTADLIEEKRDWESKRNAESFDQAQGYGKVVAPSSIGCTLEQLAHHAILPALQASPSARRQAVALFRHAFYAHGTSRRSPVTLPSNRRGFLGSFSSDGGLQNLERDADQHPHDAAKQAALLQKLNSVDPEAVLRRVESRQFATSEAVMKEYLKALVLMGRLDRTRMSDVTRVMGGEGALKNLRFSDTAGIAQGGSSAPNSSFPGAGSGGWGAKGVNAWGSGWGGMGAWGAGGGSREQRGGGDTGQGLVGTKTEPLLVSMAEPSVRQHVWRTIRSLVMTYVVLLGITTIMEERGLMRGSSSVSKDVATASTSSTKTFKDVVGVDEAKAEVEEIVEFLKNPHKFTRLGGKMTKGVLLMGPPGTGKTLLAKAIAGEAGVPFFFASGSEFEEMYVGVGARRVRDLFESAKKKSPCIVFIDEIDAIGARRNPKDQQYMRMTLNQLLSEMDGFNSAEGIVVIAATNFPEVLDKALTRPGRFDRHVVVPNPDVRGRTQILKLHLKGVPLAPNVDVEIVARGTPGFSGADLANVVNIAAIKASNDNKTAVTLEDLEFAKDRIMMGAERKSAVLTPEGKKMTAYHEGGHAIVASFTEGALPVHKATVVPRGMSLGMVMQLPEKDETSWSKKQMLAKMDVCMGGRVAEELIFGKENVTSGASSDFEQATRIAMNMVEKWGMSEKVGVVSLANLTGQSEGSAVSEETRAAIDAEVKRLTDQAYNNAKALLKKHEDKLHMLAKVLTDKETLTGEEVREVLGLARQPPPPGPRTMIGGPSSSPGS